MKILFVVILSSLLLVPTSLSARDSIGAYSIKEALELEQAKSRIGSNVKFYFGKQKHAKVIKKFGEFRSNKKTNAFGKTDEAACQWAFLSALISLRDRATREGGNAVINIKSNYKNNLTSSEKDFQCGAGAFVAGVALVGNVVKLK